MTSIASHLQYLCVDVCWRLQGVALCWDAVRGHVLYLSLASPAVPTSAASLIRSTLQRLLLDKRIVKVAYRSWEQLPAVLHHSWQLQGKLEDVGVAAWLLWPDQEDMSLMKVQVGRNHVILTGSLRLALCDKYQAVSWHLGICQSEVYECSLCQSYL